MATVGLLNEKHYLIKICIFIKDKNNLNLFNKTVKIKENNPLIILVKTSC